MLWKMMHKSIALNNELESKLTSDVHNQLPSTGANGKHSKECNIMNHESWAWTYSLAPT